MTQGSKLFMINIIIRYPNLPKLHKINPKVLRPKPEHTSFEKHKPMNQHMVVWPEEKPVRPKP